VKQIRKQNVVILLLATALVIELFLDFKDSNTNQSLGDSSEVVPAAAVAAAVIDTARSEVRMQMEGQVVVDRVRDIFRVVRADCLTLGGSTENELLDKAFCSKEWNNLLMQVRQKEANTNSLFFELDYWTMTRNPGVVNFDEFELASLTLGEQKRASVNYTVYEADTYNPARVDLVFEDGRWVIDNFHHLKYMLDIQSAMWNFVATTPEFI